MRLSDLQLKDVIDVVSGKKIGNIIDALVDEKTGKIIKMAVEPGKGFHRVFMTKGEFEISWEQIIKIGEDVILVDLTRAKTLLLN